MKGLVFNAIRILSKAQKAARAIELNPGVNLLTGENDVGKSTLIKSLYHALGADVSQMDNSRWRRANPIYCLDFTLDESDYTIVRDGKFFGVFDAGGQLISRHQGITTERGIAHFICPMLNFRIELERSADSKLGPAGPAFYFLPFYVDQDAGWTASWSSFSGLQQFRAYRKNMIEYHLGVRPQKFYDSNKREIELTDELRRLSSERSALEAVRTSYRQRKATQQVDVDPSVFRAEIELLVDQYNVVYAKQQEVLHRLKDIRNERNSIYVDLQILRRAIAELNADYEYAEAPGTPDCIDCPTCGTSITNSYVERFGFLDDIDYCQSLVDQRKKTRMEVQERLVAIENEYNDVSREVSSLDELLRRSKQSVTFSELVTSEGIKELLSAINADILEIVEKEGSVQREIATLADDLKPDRKQKKEIVEFYQVQMKEFLNKLNVHVLEEDDYKALDKVVRNNVLGSDLPRSLLAQYFAFLHAMKRFNEFHTCPMVIDSPGQQEQDDTNLDAIFEFIFNQTLPGQQLVLRIISVASLSDSIIPDDALEIELDGKYELLKADQYQDVLQLVEPLHNMTLAD